jgi:hypothetical protein
MRGYIFYVGIFLAQAFCGIEYPDDFIDASIINRHTGRDFRI